jgi:glucosamine--fructose-6-phosphate aminotransferase (isomerizing)
MGHFEREVDEQPEAFARLLASGAGTAQQIGADLKAYAPRFVVIAARGSSDNAARYAQYLFGVHHGLSVALAAPSLFTVYQAKANLERALVIGISQSGRSPDIVSVLAEGRRQGAFTVAITNAEGSPLASAAQHCLPLHAGEERAVAATKTYSAELLALAMLSAAVLDDPRRKAELERVPAAARQALSLNAGIGARAERFRYATHFVSLGRGFNYCTAFEVALKIKETSYVIAEPYSSADFLHGPIAMVDSGFPVIMVAPSAAPFDDLNALFDLLDARAAELVAISDRPEVLAKARVALELPPKMPEWLSPLVAILPGQLWAGALARSRGLDPDRPRGLNKVTETR